MNVIQPKVTQGESMRFLDVILGDEFTQHEMTITPCSSEGEAMAILSPFVR